MGRGGGGGGLFTVRASTRSLFSRDVSTANWNEQFNDGETPLLVNNMAFSGPSVALSFKDINFYNNKVDFILENVSFNYHLLREAFNTATAFESYTCTRWTILL